MIPILPETKLIRDDTKELIAFAEMGEYPCKYCKFGAQRFCDNSCRAWPVWFSVHWRNLQRKLKR